MTDEDLLNPTALGKGQTRPMRDTPVNCAVLGATFHAIGGVLVTAHALVESLQQNKTLDPACRLEQRLGPDDLRALDALRAAVEHHKAVIKAGR